MSPRPARHTPSGELLDALTRLFETAHTGIYFGTLRREGAGTTLAANPYLKLMFGCAPDSDDAAIRPLDEESFVHPQARPAFVGQLLRDGTVTDYLLRLRRADGTPIWVEVTAHTGRRGDAGEDTGGNAGGDGGDAGGGDGGDQGGGDGAVAIDGAPIDAVAIDAVFRDVSERRKLEEEGRDIYHQLLQTDKLVTLGQTVSGVAHELNNPLATIMTWSERLAGRSLDALTKRGVDTILSESERAAKIVRNLLTFSRKRHTTRGLVDVNEVVRETLSLRAYDQRISHITTIEALATGLPPVFADANHLKQVLLNLVINAEQAMLSANGQGTLIVRSWHDVKNHAAVLEINDDGAGIPEDVQAKIFDPFFTTKSAGMGTGLGLTVAHSIVQDHGGEIRVESTPGQGSSFHVHLPTAG